MSAIDDTTLAQIERRYAAGLTSAEILELFASHAIPFSEATLRKYIQLGLLPRSVRVGRKGKHQGSQGIYPVNVVREILRIKQMMAQSFTIEQIQRDFAFMRSDLQQLEHTLDSVFKKLDQVVKDRKRDVGIQGLAKDVREARSVGKDLLSRLFAIETRLGSSVRVERAIAS